MEKGNMGKRSLHKLVIHRSAAVVILSFLLCVLLLQIFTINRAGKAIGGWHHSFR
jgi:hypothetical protein